MRAQNKKNSGFTLLEMSIVLVIIGLITGGIMVGRSLIRNSQLQSVIADMNKYSDAIKAFKQKYKYLPGDMPTATSFWGANTGVGAACGDAASPSATTSTTSTCNGNGDNIIGGTTAGSTSTESAMVWKHLSDAGMVDGNFTGMTHTGTGSPLFLHGSNLPLSRVDSAGYYLTNIYELWAPATADARVYTWDTKNIHVLAFGADLSNTWSFAPVISPVEAYNIDSKIDDGNPGLGLVRSPKKSGGAGWGDTCATTTSESTAAYDLSLKGKVCSLFFQQAY